VNEQQPLPHLKVEATGTIGDPTWVCVACGTKNHILMPVCEQCHQPKEIEHGL
jgi:hypothetical protein